MDEKLFWLLIIGGVIVYFCIGFFVCRRAGWYYELFRDFSDLGFLEDMIERGPWGLKPYAKDALWGLLYTIFWPFVVLMVLWALLLGFALFLLLLLLYEREDDNDSEFE